MIIKKFNSIITNYNNNFQINKIFKYKKSKKRFNKLSQKKIMIFNKNYHYK